MSEWSFAKVNASRHRRQLAALLLAVLVIQLPFILLMPFHIDDAVFLMVARNIRQTDVFPSLRPTIWEGRFWSDMMSHPHPPLLCFYIYALQSIAGEYPEQVVHLGFSLFTLLLAAGFYYFFRFLKLPPLLGTTLALFSPMVFVSSHTIMMDIPAIALGLAGVTTALYGLRDGRPGQVMIGGTLIGLAGLVAYSAVFYLIPPIIYGLWFKNRVRNLILLGLPVAVCLGGWVGLVFLATHRFVLTDFTRLLAMYRVRSNGADVATRLLYNLGVTGGMIIFPLALLAWKFRTIRGKLYLLAGLLIGLWVSVRFPGEGYYHHIALAIIGGAGVVLLAEAGVMLGRQRESSLGRAEQVTIGGWAVFFFLLTLICFPHGAVRYQLWLLPPLTAMFMASGWEMMRSRKILLVVLLSGQVILASAMALADMEMARGYRQAVVQIKAQFGQSGARLWVAGEWELRHYVIEAGGRTILRYDRRPQRGDVVISPALTASTYETCYEREPYGQLLNEFTLRPAFPVRLLNHRVRAGFYSDYWGLIPVWWASDNVPVEILRIYRVQQSLPPNPEKEADNIGLLPPPVGASLPE